MNPNAPLLGAQSFCQHVGFVEPKFCRPFFLCVVCGLGLVGLWLGFVL